MARVVKVVAAALRRRLAQRRRQLWGPPRRAANGAASGAAGYGELAADEEAPPGGAASPSLASLTAVGGGLSDAEDGPGLTSALRQSDGLLGGGPYASNVPSPSPLGASPGGAGGLDAAGGGGDAGALAAALAAPRGAARNGARRGGQRRGGGGGGSGSGLDGHTRRAPPTGTKSFRWLEDAVTEWADSEGCWAPAATAAGGASGGYTRQQVRAFACSGRLARAPRCFLFAILLLGLAAARHTSNQPIKRQCAIVNNTPPPPPPFKTPPPS